MGFYINPANQTKEEFLRDFGIACHGVIPATNAASIDETNAYVVVCLVNNGDFTAAGICYTQDELEAFKHPDPRPKRWYIVELKHLRPYLHGQSVSAVTDHKNGTRVDMV